MMLLLKFIGEIALFLFLSGMISLYNRKVVIVNEDKSHIYGNKIMQIIIKAFIPAFAILTLYIMIYQSKLFFILLIVTFFIDKPILMPMVERCFIIPLSKIIVRHKEGDG